MRLGFVFRSFPHSNTKGREGLDALLAASAYCEDIEVFFLGNGVTQLVKEQAPKQILSRDYISAFKLLELYDIEKIYACRTSLLEFNLCSDRFIIDVEVLSFEEINHRLHNCQKILTF
ncbi:MULTISPECIES: sulfurtransferase complex subunit TusC [Vibrio]|uniref:Protein TusC homolog n=1 Tax=Vibrio casei TaxID=673372 RepID=A0A368LKG7_9VIBR|nr:MULTISPECIES: sulfurtransferase complex subunit TusC [Vibrio]RCS72390.1 sulfurtransferase complex subunit TusC [Vibrio casei]SJN29318.1 tRNA 5-methylaminomethyl-2-thiouridine synthase TusC [Vibrio casei]HBV76081.1 sulfurtransferase complex subunit TusC [Vibrio sp.]